MNSFTFPFINPRKILLLFLLFEISFCIFELIQYNFFCYAVANCKRNLPLMCDKPMIVPQFAVDEDLLSTRKSLPIWAKKEQITLSIEKNPVVIITAETGSGKTTQV